MTYKPILCIAISIMTITTLTSCGYAPIRDAIGYTVNKCTGMGFVPGTVEHRDCQMQLEIQYSKNAALKNAAWQLRNK